MAWMTIVFRRMQWFWVAVIIKELDEEKKKQIHEWSKTVKATTVSEKIERGKEM